ncbi:ornithine cyclodeaminase family protein [Alterinioella nitratireducens]|uniref:ornithine cyclodeaminase family protein n=1 Tax=Alterinioella nitratireducens TaxID=2735915 RepID=UPI0015544E37|nr:ornithine cyclodeaminase family protein [Alterinioella nitratireducens]NPD18778.1 ornithine cyclodeaminase family protein [Alterinioella nitratireducens]
MTDDEFLILSDTDLEGLGLSGAQIVDAIEEAIRAEAAGEVSTAPKSAVLPGDGRYMMTTLSSADTPDLTIVKSVMVSPRNPARGRPGIDGAILIQDSETGQMRALCEAGWVTGVRTAGLSAVAARRLANPEAQSIAFIGCGMQARSHLAIFNDLFPLTSIRASGRGQANIDRLCDMGRRLGLETRASTTPQEAIEEADIVVSSITLDYEVAPFLDARWLKPGAFAAVTDLGIPWNPEGMEAISPLFIDDMAQEEASPKKLVAPDLVTGDLKHLLTDGPGEMTPDTPRAFLFRGLAIGDFAIARLGYLAAKNTGRGQKTTW